MRFEKGHKETTRRRIVELASAAFRKDGVDAVGIAGLMAQAGLTHGGFYAHFESKDALVREALTAAFDASRLRRSGDLESLVRRYLRPAHRDHPEKGCAIAALASEIARHPGETRSAFSARMEQLVDHIATLLPEMKPELERRSTATAILGVLTGTLQMSRTVDDTARADEILKCGITAALHLAASSMIW